MTNIVNNLLLMQDLKYKEFNKNLCPDTQKEMIGIRVPKLRKYAKEIVEENDWEEFVKNENVRYFEEVMLQGFVIGYSKLEFEEKLKYITLFVPRIDSWAISDTFVPTLKIKEKNLKQYWNYILKYLNSDKEFEIRFALISMLDYFINDKYIDKVIEKINNISNEGYYVRMGKAWLLAEIGIKYNEKLIEYLNGDNNLDKFTYNKTLQKMIESYRIDIKQKELLRKMKRK